MSFSTVTFQIILSFTLDSTYDGIAPDVIIDEPGPDYEPTLTQSYGTFIVLFGKEAVDNDPHGGSPGASCNGHTGFLAGP